MYQYERDSPDEYEEDDEIEEAEEEDRDRAGQTGVDEDNTEGLTFLYCKTSHSDYLDTYTILL